MAEYRVVQNDPSDFTLYKVEGLQHPVLKGRAVVFPCDIQLTDDDQTKQDKMTKAVYDVRHDNRHVQDGDIFETPYAKLVVRGNLVVVDTNGGQVAAAAAQTNVPTGPQNLGHTPASAGISAPAAPGPVPTLGQLAQQHGAQLPTMLQPYANTPINQLPGHVMAPPGWGIPKPTPPANQSTQQATGLAGLNQATASVPVATRTFVAVDSQGGSATGQIVPASDSNTDIVDAFDAHINYAFGDGDVLNSIRVHDRRVIEVGYASGLKVLLDVK